MNDFVRTLGTKLNLFLTSISNYKKHKTFLQLDNDENILSPYLIIHNKYYDIYKINLERFNSLPKRTPRKLYNLYKNNVRRAKTISELAKRLYKRDYLNDVCWYGIDIENKDSMTLKTNINENLVFKHNARYWTEYYLPMTINQDRYYLFSLLMKYEDTILNF